MFRVRHDPVRFAAPTAPRQTGVYISRDPIACASILFLCPEGFVPFYDDTGCACRLAPH
jgi:hypothetical protein